MDCSGPITPRRSRRTLPTGILPEGEGHAKGLASGLLDFLNISRMDIERKKEYPPIVSMNDDADKQMIQNGALPLIYKIQPTAQLNSDMFVFLQAF